MFDFRPATGRFGIIAAAVTPADLDRPTPCAGWSVRDLLEHAASGPRFFAAIARHDVADVRPVEIDDGGAWQDAVAADLDALVDTWRRPEAWEGETTVGELTFPNEQWARIGFDEAVLHGWDLAVATDQTYRPTEEILDIVEPFVEETTTGPPVEGLWGSPIPIGDGGSRFARILGLSGRDPDWAPDR